VGVRERGREKAKTKESSKPSEEKQVEISPPSTETITEEEISSPEVVIETIQSTSTEESAEEANSVHESIPTTAEQDFVSPSWGNIEETEWMYGIPSREEDKEMWAEEWADYVLEWSEAKKAHVLSLATFISEPPFKDFRNKVDSFKIITQILVDKEVAEWIDKKERQLRVYWRPLEDWADILYQWALKTGKLRLDVKSIVIQEVKQDFASLPEKDIHIVLALMVKKGLASWVDEKKGAIIIVT